jgi:hypothetical protein
MAASLVSNLGLCTNAEDGCVAGNGKEAPYRVHTTGELFMQSLKKNITGISCK